MHRSLRCPALVALLTLLVATLALAAAPVASETYPPPVGSLSLTSSATTAATGSLVTLSVTVLDNDGNPVEGAEVTFRIVSQPGDDASVGSLKITKTTDEDGIATADLNTGTTPGSIIVETISGEKTSRLTIEVGEGEEGVPSTGSEPAAGGGGPAVWLIALLAAGGAALTGGGALLVMARRRARS
ncbi:MAG: Ig-like domain-containing protein [Chloroflexi bacterium]|nr:Ig-like domain-containing protein [Chloroflexota bacterium]